MKRRILLLDESLTVQKVVALTLDRDRFAVTNAKTRSEAMKMVLESPPDCILVSDQVSGISASTFPKEVEAWAGRDRKIPPLVLITSLDLKAQRGYAAVLKKPFSPQSLQACVMDALVEPMEEVEAAIAEAEAEKEDTRLQKVFSDAFSDEAKLVSETFQSEIDETEDTLLNIPAPSQSSQKNKSMARRGPPAAENVAEFWGKPQESESEVHVLGPEDSMAYKAQLEKEVGRQLDSYDLEDVVNRLLEKMVPPIVEKLAQERLDRLLKESESFVELKP